MWWYLGLFGLIVWIVLALVIRVLLEHRTCKRPSRQAMEAVV